MTAAQLEVKLEAFENEFPGLYLPTDPGKFHGDRMADDYLCVSHWCSLNREVIAAVLLELRRVDVVGDRLLTHFLVATLSLLETDFEKRVSPLKEILARLVDVFVDRYGFGVIASRLNAIGAFPALCKRAGLHVIANGIHRLRQR